MLNPTASAFVPGAAPRAAAAAPGAAGSAAPGAAAAAPADRATGKSPAPAAPITIRVTPGRPPQVATGGRARTPSGGAPSPLLPASDAGCPTALNGLAELARVLSGDLTFEEMFSHDSRRGSVSDGAAAGRAGEPRRARDVVAPQAAA
jgi:hypothetical protein